MALRIEDCIEITPPTLRQERVSTMDIYWPSFYWGMAALILAWLASLNGCSGLSEAECAAINGVCSNGGCF